MLGDGNSEQNTSLHEIMGLSSSCLPSQSDIISLDSPVLVFGYACVFDHISLLSVHIDIEIPNETLLEIKTEEVSYLPSKEKRLKNY